MAITFVKYWGSHFKSERQAHGMARALSYVTARGWRAVLVLSRPPDDIAWLDRLAGVGALVEYLPRASRNFDLACTRSVKRLCEKLGASVFHCDNIHTSPLVGAALARVPVRVWHKRSMEPAFEECRQPDLRERLAVSVRVSSLMATSVLCVSSAVRDELLTLGVSPKKVSVFSNPWPGPVPRIDREVARANLGYGPTDVVICTLGHAVPVKGWDTLVEAFSKLAQEVPTSHLLLLGSYRETHERATYAELVATIERHGLGDRVRFAGHVADMVVPFSASDVFVFPSRSEGHANALMEAMATGLPVVASRVGAAPEIIRDGENGLLVDRENVGQLSSALRRLALDPDMRRRLGEAAQARPNLPTPREYQEHLAALYADLLQAASPPIGMLRGSQEAERGKR